MNIIKKYFSFFLFGFASFIITCNSQPNDGIILGKIDSLHSYFLNEERKILVYVPSSSKNNPNNIYPVVYLLDGNNHFNSVTAMIQNLSEVLRNTVLPQMIVIGIQHTDRIGDFSGGAFTSFMEKELIPYVDSIYPTSRYRILIGHSFGGAYTINTLFNNTELFKSYIAIDPMSFDNHKLIEQANKFLKEKDFTGNSFYLAIANSPLVYSQDTSFHNNYRVNLKLLNSMEIYKQNHLKFSWKFYKNDNHTSVPFIAEYEGLRFIFDFYKFPDVDILSGVSNPDSFILHYYENITKILGYKVTPPEGELLSLGYILIENKSYDKSYKILKMLVDNYPPNFMFYNALGDLYRTQGDSLKAIEYYNKTLSLNPNDGLAKQMIQTLKENVNHNK